MGNSNGKRFPVLASDKLPPRKTPNPANGVLWVVEKRTNEVYITKYPKRDRWFTNLGNQLKRSKDEVVKPAAEPKVSPCCGHLKRV
jgi:hypothetical protein